jgi:ADP-ribose pyrophosphatase YjhB (NUDIX family)
MSKRLLLQIWRWLPLPARIRWGLTWLVTSRFLVGVLAIIFDDQGRILLLKHTYRPDYPWGLPGGWLKAGEGAAAGIERELLEETGFVVRATQPLMVGGAKAHSRLDLVFLCELVSGTFRPSAEVSEARFFEPGDLPAEVEPYQGTIVALALPATGAEERQQLINSWSGRAWLALASEE